MRHQTIIQKIHTKIKQVENTYHRLVLIVGTESKDKKRILKELSDQLNVPLINLNLHLSEKLLSENILQRQLPGKASMIITEIVNNHPNDRLVLDNTELLFCPELQLNPLSIFQRLSRNKTLIVSWNGEINQTNLKYAIPDHPEFRLFPLDDLTYIHLNR